VLAERADPAGPEGASLMRSITRCALVVALSAGFVTAGSTAHASPPNGGGYLRALGTHAQSTLEPRSSTVGALVRVPSSLAPASVGLTPFVPGFARLRGTPDQLLAFVDAHPDLPLEVAPPPHLLLNLVGQWTNAITARAEYGVDGSGALVGIVDTGVDFTLADFDDGTGHTRIQWMLDLTLASAAPPGSITPATYADLEAVYGGAVYSNTDIDNLIGNAEENADVTDTVGHGTHVASIAAGNGGLGKKYVGIAPGADLIIARVTRDATDSLATDDVLTGVQFAFERADALRKPIAVNLSLGTDFGPHDGTMAWEETLASYVGPTHPGHALVVAAGNSGDITTQGVHASVFVPPGGTRSIPIACLYGGTDLGGGQVQAWITMRGDANLSIGLESPSGTWISPVGQSSVGVTPDSAPYTANVDNGASVSQGMIPTGSNSAIVLWNGRWAAGTYNITLSANGGGSGVADLWVEGSGDAVDGNGNGVSFVDGVREGTINIPATSPGLIAVGCTVNRPSWTSIDNGFVSVALSPLDSRGGYPLPDASTVLFSPTTGDTCWFSSAGPTVTGVQKPEISAPGGIVIGAMSGYAGTTGPYSIFNNPDCPSVVDGGPPDPNCMQVDPTHAVAAGTSMSAPQAAGVAALLFEKDPTLTQDQILALLQAGAHQFRTGPPRFDDQGGPGEIDAQGSLDALDQMQNPANVLPSKAASWLTTSADELTADGSTPLTVIVELRTVLADGVTHRADFFSSDRLAALVQLNGATLSTQPAIVRRGPGVWVYTVTPPAGLGAQTVTLGATFDGEPIVTPHTLAIATDVWTANYPSSAKGSCSLQGAPDASGTSKDSAWWTVAGLVLGAVLWRRRRHSPASETIQPWGSHT